MGQLFGYSENSFTFSRSIDWKPSEHPYTMHTHSRAEIYRFLRGKGVFHIEGSEYVMESGDILVMSPTEAHYIELVGNEPYARVCIHLRVDMFRAMDPEGILLKPILDRKPGEFNLYKSHEFSGGSDRYWQTMEAASGDRRLNIVTGMMALLNEMYSIHISRKEDPGTTGDTVEHQIIRYLNNNLAAEVSLDELCQKYFVSKSQLCRMFKKATGTTIWQYVTAKRLARARLMLRDGEKPTKVYSVCGFNDYSAFYRAYVKRYGHGPHLE